MCNFCKSIKILFCIFIYLVIDNICFVICMFSYFEWAKCNMQLCRIQVCGIGGWDGVGWVMKGEGGGNGY